MSDILETMHEYANFAETKSEREAFEAVINEITRLRARLAPVDDDKLVAIGIGQIERGNERQWHFAPIEAKNDLYNRMRTAIAAIRPHIEAAALSDLVEFSKHKSWSLNYKRPFYCDDDDQEQCWVVYEEIGPINDRDWNVIGKGETAAEAIAAAIRSGN